MGLDGILGIRYFEEERNWVRRGGFRLAMGAKVRLIGPAPKRRLQWQGLTRGWLRNCIGMASCAGAEEPWGEEISRWEEDRMLIQLSGSESGPYRGHGGNLTSSGSWVRHRYPPFFTLWFLDLS